MHTEELIERILETVAEEYDAPASDDPEAWHFTDKQVRDLIQWAIEEYHEMIAPSCRPAACPGRLPG